MDQREDSAVGSERCADVRVVTCVGREMKPRLFDERMRRAADVSTS
jgi:hypothetical protein